MPHPYAILDVFTDQAFAGNPLAVVFEADNLDGEAMQLIADEAGCEKRECVVCCDSLYTINTECDHRVCAKCFASWHFARNCNDAEMNCPMCRLPVF